MSTAIEIDTLSTVLMEQLELYRDLASILEREHSALEQRQLENLIGITSSKMATLVALEKSEQQLSQLIRHYRQTASEKLSLRQIIALIDQRADSSLIDLEQQLSQLANHCKDQNQINGIILNARRRTNHHILTLIQKQQAVDYDNTYSSKGQTGANLLSNSLAKA